MDKLFSSMLGVINGSCGTFYAVFYVIHTALYCIHRCVFCVVDALDYAFSPFNCTFTFLDHLPRGTYVRLDGSGGTDYEA
ncbi:hypothetical protein M5689_007639 [Euphorbia peplus]|nr:hypothetical protein M5689_007639 [Euphorbia peplus]